MIPHPIFPKHLPPQAGCCVRLIGDTEGYPQWACTVWTAGGVFHLARIGASAQPTLGLLLTDLAQFPTAWRLCPVPLSAS